MAPANAVHPGRVAVQAGGAQPHRALRQLVALPDDDPVRGGVGAEDVAGRAAADPEPAPLSDCEVVVAQVAAEDAPPGIDDLTGPITEVAVAAQELALVLPREEAEVLALGAARDSQAGARGDLADLRLRQLAQREAEPPQ